MFLPGRKWVMALVNRWGCRASMVRGRRFRADDRGRRAAARCLCVFEYISVFHYFIYIKTSIAPVELTLVLLN